MATFLPHFGYTDLRGSKNNIGFCHCPWLPTRTEPGKSLLLKTPQTLVAEYKEVNLELTENSHNWRVL